MNITKDYYTINSGKPLNLFNKLVKEQRRIHKLAVEFVDKIGGKSFGPPTSTFSVIGLSGLAGVGFEGGRTA